VKTKEDEMETMTMIETETKAETKPKRDSAELPEPPAVKLHPCGAFEHGPIALGQGKRPDHAKEIPACVLDY
jgi:hypothetical protein